jgi:hypothetical protein
MTIEDGLKAFLGGSPYPLAVQSRVYSHKAPQNATAPYIVIYRISATPRHGHRGGVPTLERLFQFSVFSPSQSEAIGIADALRRLLDGYSGAMGSYSVRGAFWSNERALFNEVSGLHQIAADYTIQYREP